MESNLKKEIDFAHKKSGHDKESVKPEFCSTSQTYSKAYFCRGCKIAD